MGMVFGSLLLLMYFIIFFNAIVGLMNRKKQAKELKSRAKLAASPQNGAVDDKIAAAIAMAIFLSKKRMPALYKEQSENNHRMPLAPWRYPKHIRPFPPRISRPRSH